MDTASTPTPPTPTTCVSTTEGCLTQSELNDRKLTLARSYRSWGGQAYINSYFLDGINADDAYGHLKLMGDIDIDQLGAGVDIGIYAVFGGGYGSLPRRKLSNGPEEQLQEWCERAKAHVRAKEPVNK